MKYVIYLRVSTIYQDVASQRKMCLDYIDRKGGGEWVEFVDQDVKGSLRMEDRDQMLNAIDALKPGDVFLIDSRDRLGRDPVLNVLTEKEIQKRKASLECVALNFDGMEPATVELMKTIMDGFSKFELYLIGRRTRNKLREMKASGFRTGRIPYGYTLGEAIERTVITPKGPQKKVTHKITQNPTEYQILEKMERASREGETVRAIAARLNRDGIMNREGNPWSHVSIHKILKNAPSHRAVYSECHHIHQCI